MTLSPNDIAKAQHLLEERRKLQLELHKTGGHTDVTVGGRYYSSSLSEEEQDKIIDIMKGFFNRTIADVDAQLLEIGVSVQPSQ